MNRVLRKHTFTYKFQNTVIVEISMIRYNEKPLISGLKRTGSFKNEVSNYNLAFEWGHSFIQKPISTYELVFSKYINYGPISQKQFRHN